MKQVSFYRFCIGFLAAIFLGVIFACLQSNWPCWLTNLFAPVCGSPWEQSKLAFWPILGGIAIAKVSTKEQGGGELPMLVLTPIALSLALWLTQSRGNYFLLLWVVALAAGWALSGRGCKGRHVWLLLAVAMAAAYVLFTFLPPMAGPFLDPSDVAAMATIPC